MAAEMFEKLTSLFTSNLSVKAEEEEEEEEEEVILLIHCCYYDLTIFSCSGPS